VAIARKYAGTLPVTGAVTRSVRGEKNQVRGLATFRNVEEPIRVRAAARTCHPPARMPSAGDVVDRPALSRGRQPTLGHGLGLVVSATTVRTWLRGTGLGPARTRGGTTWSATDHSEPLRYGIHHRDRDKTSPTVSTRCFAAPRARSFGCRFAPGRRTGWRSASYAPFAQSVSTGC
jgi:hypothetical protein